MNERSRPVLSPALYLVAALLLAGIGRFAAAGLSTRYWADDFCYSAVMAAGGFLRGPLDWFMASGNRFSTIYLAGLQDLLGPGAIRLVTGLILLALTLGWLAFLRAVVLASGSRPGFVSILPLALAQVFFLALLAPDRLQSLYWRMGALHYTFPLALLLLNLALILAGLANSRLSWVRILGVFLLAFFAGGFSETFAAMQAGMYALAWIAVALASPRPAKLRLARLFTLPSFALLGALAAMGLMLLSPSNAWRQAALPPPSNLGQLIAYTLRYTGDFTADTLRGAPLPFLALAVISAAAAYPAFWLIRPRLPAPARLLAGAGLFILAGLALCACAIAPSVYAGLQFPAGRALMPAAFALMLGLSGAAACLAAVPLSFAGIRTARGETHLAPTARRLDFQLEGLLFLALLVGSFYIGRHLTQPLPEQARMVVWAGRWDERDARIRELLAAGQTDLSVPEIEVVRGLEDLGPDAGHWVNRCAAAYYRANSLKALP
jgi:hypothetical protein